MKKTKTFTVNESSTTFRNLTITLSETIGQHQIPLVHNATHPANVITSDAVHYDLVKKILRRIYRANRCYHLNAKINFQATFDALGQIQAELLDSTESDIDQINLLHDIGASTREFFFKLDIDDSKITYQQPGSNTKLKKEIGT